MREMTRVCRKLLVGVVAVAMLPIALSAGTAGAADEVGSEVPPEVVLPIEEPVLDETLSGQEALAGLDAVELAAVAEEVGWSSDQLSNELAHDDSLHVTPDGDLLYIESAEQFAGVAPQSAVEEMAASAAAASFSDAETFTLHSLPGSNRVVYLNFVGMIAADHLVGNGPLPAFDLDGTLPCPLGTADPACFTAAELTMIRDIWVRVAEAFSAFDVDITTENPGVEALENRECYQREDIDGNLFWICPDGVTPEVGDERYGAQISFTDGGFCEGGFGCGYLGSFDRNDFQAIRPREPDGAVHPSGFARAGQLTTSMLARTAVHEIGHVVGLPHDANPETEDYSCVGPPPGSLWQPVMRRCFGALGTEAPLEHITPNICRDEPFNVDDPRNIIFQYCLIDLVFTNQLRDSYGWMALHGVAARADDPTPVVVSEPSFVGSGVISPPVLTGPEFYAPSPPPQDFNYTFGATTGPGQMSYGLPGLLISNIDGSGNDIGAVLDTLDDDNSPLRAFVTLINPRIPGLENETWAVSAITTLPGGYRYLTARRVTHNHLDHPYGPAVLRVHGTGQSGPMDTDAYTFSVPAGAGPTAIGVTPRAFSSLDVKATLYDGSMTPVATSDPPAARVDVDTATGVDASITATLAPGDYTLVVEGASLSGVYPNYGSIGSYTVSIDTQVPQIVAFTSTAPNDAVVGGPSYTPTATASSGLAVAITVDATSAGVCSLAAGAVSFAGTGTCTLNANQAGNPTYFPAEQVQQSFTVQQQSQTVSFTSTAPTDATVSGPTYAPTATASSGLAVAITVDSASAGVCSIAAGAVSFAGTGTCTLNANQAGNATYLPAAQQQQSFSVFQTPSFVLASPATTGTVGQPYTYTFQASGVPTPTYTLAVGAPAWLSIDATSGVVSGTPPTGTTSFSYSVLATSSVGAATAGPFAVTVTTPPPTSTRADLSITLSCPSTARINVNATCSLTVRNDGPATAQNVSAVLTLPSSLRPVSVSSGGVTAGSTVRWTQSSLAANTSTTYTVTVRPTSARRVTVLGAVVATSPDPDLLNNLASASITVTR